jgi:hypothetical protein
MLNLVGIRHNQVDHTPKQRALDDDSVAHINAYGYR